MKPNPIPQMSETDRARFWALVDRRTVVECWLWKGAKSRSGGFEYANYRIPSVDRTYKAHRIAYTLLVGPIPDGLTLDHLRESGRCSSTLCCNPWHLEPVTQSVNTQRMHAAKPKRTTCKRGHPRVPGQPCRSCAVAAVARSMAKKPEKYREMKRLQKQKERARAKAAD